MNKGRIIILTCTILGMLSLFMPWYSTSMNSSGSILGEIHLSRYVYGYQDQISWFAFIGFLIPFILIIVNPKNQEIRGSEKTSILILSILVFLFAILVIVVIPQMNEQSKQLDVNEWGNFKWKRQTLIHEPTIGVYIILLCSIGLFVGVLLGKVPKENFNSYNKPIIPPPISSLNVENSFVSPPTIPSSNIITVPAPPPPIPIQSKNERGPEVSPIAAKEISVDSNKYIPESDYNNEYQLILEQERNSRLRKRMVVVFILLVLIIGSGAILYFTKNDEGTSNKQNNSLSENAIVEQSSTASNSSESESTIKQPEYDYQISNLANLNNYEDLFSLYPNYVTVISSEGQDGEYYMPAGKKYTIFKGTDDELVIIVDKKGKLFNISTEKNGNWQFPFGLRVGMEIKEIEALNKKPFSFIKFETDHGGEVNWDGGLLDGKGIYATISYEGNPQQDFFEDYTYKSNDSKNIKIKPFLKAINIQKSEINAATQTSKRELQYLYASNGGLMGFFSDGTVASCPRCDFVEENVNALHKEKPSGKFTATKEYLQSNLNGQETQWLIYNEGEIDESWAMINFKWLRKP